MLLRVVRPMKRRESSKHYFRQRIPLDVLERARGMTLTLPLGGELVTTVIAARATEVKVSLRTSDPSEAKARQGVIAAYLEGVWRSLRTGPITLSHKQTVALAGEVYRDWVASLEEEPGNPEMWDRVLADNKAAVEGEFGIAALMIPGPEKLRRSLESRFGPFADVLLARHGLIVDDESRHRLLMQTAKALDLAAQKTSKFAEGDYSDDGVERRFPKWEETTRPAPVRTGIVSLKGVVEDWWREAKAAGTKLATYESYRNTMKRFVNYLGHDDAGRVMVEDVIGFKDHRLAEINPRTGKPISPKTVKDSDLAGLRAVFGWAVTNRRMAINPAVGITIKLGKKMKVRSLKGFTDSEAKALLTAARNLTRGRERPKIFAAKRWVPWLCAYTGARVGEMVQLRKEDVRKEGEHWVLTITPEAGTVKTNEVREVVLHSHLVDLGFPAFVEASADGHLFLTSDAKREVRGALRTTKNRITEFVRTVVTDRNVAPNHGWRHRFKTVGMAAGIETRYLDAIQGHAPRTEGDDYGDVTVEVRAREIAKLPRYEI